MSDDIRIYVACLASYNSGTLHGEWIDATLGVDHIWEEVRAMLRASPEPNVMVLCQKCCGSPKDVGADGCDACKGTGKVPSAEEWAIHDYEGFAGLKLGEGESFDKVAEIAELLEEHGKAYAAYVDLVGSEYATADGFSDAYQGHHTSAEEWAAQWLEDTGALQEVPESLRNYIDYESYARDASYDGMSFVDAGSPDYGVYVFSTI
jgi:antirestriction protein